MLAVVIDHFTPPTLIQNRRNKQSFDTCAFIIDLVPIVFEKICFADHKSGNRWKLKEKMKAQYIIHIPGMRYQGNIGKVHFRDELDQSATMGQVHIHHGVTLPKGAANGLGGGPAGPWGRPAP